MRRRNSIFRAPQLANSLPRLRQFHLGKTTLYLQATSRNDATSDSELRKEEGGGWREGGMQGRCDDRLRINLIYLASGLSCWYSRVLRIVFHA